MAADPLARKLRDVVGGRTAKLLDDLLDLRTVGDLVGHYPRNYLRTGDLTDLSTLREGDQVTVLAEVASVHTRNMRNRPGAITTVVITDGERELELTFFKQRWREKQLRPGTQGVFAGRISSYGTKKQLAHPECQVLGHDPTSDAAGERLAQLPVIPVYSVAGKLTSWTVTLAVSVVLDMLDPLPDPMPPDLRAAEGLLGYDEAIRTLHLPRSLAAVQRAKHRLKWDEALQLQVVLARRRADVRAQPAVPRAGAGRGLRARFEASLPYTLTAGQAAVVADIDADLSRDRPMHRLLAGEVGSGKTVVSLLAMLRVIDAGGQAAMLAPTEVLAAQHLRSLRGLLGVLGRAGELDGDPDGTRVALLTGSQSAAERRAALAAAADGSAGIVVGTHALLSEGVEFQDLGLVVVDEQHRFGVEQRAALRARGRAGTSPHLLVMTATPIPRTVAMTVFGDLETSQLTELPGGRQEIATHVVPDGLEQWRRRMWQKVRDEVAAGRQAFVVCPRIDPDEADPNPDEDTEGPARRPAAAATEVRDRLAAEELAGLRVGLLHGRLPADEKDAVMRAFAAGDLDVLVATTVIEVGVDVPNATVMVVLDADRFGISQLHQLRGRVGRGAHASTCLLHSALPDDAPAMRRLVAVAATNDGYELAQADLRLRGEGDVLGASQAGRRRTVRLLRVLDDVEIVTGAQRAAQELVAADAGLGAYPVLAAAVAALEEGAADEVTFLEKG